MKSDTEPLFAMLFQAVQIYKDDSKGMLTPAVLADVNGDGVEDIVISTFNSHVIAFNGQTFRQIWNVSFAGGESYSTLGAGYYDGDDVPDFMVKYQFGEGYPVYEYEKVSATHIIVFSLILPVTFTFHAYCRL